MHKMLLRIFVTLSLGTSVLCFNYSRERIQADHPGFGTDWIPIDVDENGEFVIGYFQKDGEERIFGFSPEPREVVTFTLFTRQYPNGTNDTWTHLDKTKPTKFVTHGWLASGEFNTCVTIKDGFLEKYDANVFITDWSEISQNVVYSTPMSATKAVGDYYAEFLDKIIDFGIEPKSIHLVGHSLGAHVSGFAARGTKSRRIGRVTGLDPALPGFNIITLVEGGRLRKTDADFVDVIHTCAGFLGIRHSIGHVDFYPNGGGVPQPGCESVVLLAEACSHGRSWRYFAESLTEETSFTAYPCDSFKNFLNEEACQDGGVPMGDSTPVDTRGDFFLRTQRSPFALTDMYYVAHDNRIGNK